MRNAETKICRSSMNRSSNKDHGGKNYKDWNDGIRANEHEDLAKALELESTAVDELKKDLAAIK